MKRPGDEPDRVREGVPEPGNVESAFREGTRIDRALRKAVLDALRVHKQLGNPVAVWRDGQVRWIPPEQIPSEG